MFKQRIRLLTRGVLTALVIAGTAHIASAQTPTRAITSPAALSDPSAWENGIVPINTPDQTFTIIDNSGASVLVIIDLPTVIDSIDAPSYRLSVENECTISGQANLQRIDVRANGTISMPQAGTQSPFTTDLDAEAGAAVFLSSVSQIDSTIVTLDPDSVVDLPSLTDITNASFFNQASTISPIGPLSAVDGSRIEIRNQSDLTINDPTIDQPISYAASNQSSITFAGSSTLIQRPEIPNTLPWLLINIGDDSHITFPALTTFLRDDENPTRLTVRFDGSRASFALPVLQHINEIDINVFGSFNTDNTVELPLLQADTVEITATSVDMSNQTSLTQGDRVWAESIHMPGLITASGARIDTAQATFTSMTTFEEGTITLREHPETSAFNFRMATSGTIRNSTITTFASGDIHANVGNGNRLSLNGNTLHIASNLIADELNGPGVIKVGGNLTPRNHDNQRVLPTFSGPLTVHMQGQGTRFIAPLLPDIGGNQQFDPQQELYLTLGSETTTTYLNFRPLRSGNPGALYLFRQAPESPFITLQNGSTLYLDGGEIYAQSDSRDPAASPFFPVANLIPNNQRCTDYTDGRLCLRACPPDLNNDNIVDLGDINTFVDLFLAADIAADANNDGFLDTADISAFVQAFLAGC